MFGFENNLLKNEVHLRRIKEAKPPNPSIWGMQSHLCTLKTGWNDTTEENEKPMSLKTTRMEYVCVIINPGQSTEKNQRSMIFFFFQIQVIRQTSDLPRWETPLQLLYHFHLLLGSDRVTHSITPPCVCRSERSSPEYISLTRVLLLWHQQRETRCGLIPFSVPARGAFLSV